MIVRDSHPHARHDGSVSRQLHFLTLTDPHPPPSSTRWKIVICAPRALRVCTGLGPADVGPCATHPGASAGSVAGGGAAREAACGGRQIAIFAISCENRDLRTLVLVVHVQGWVVPTSGRALRTLEQARAAWRAAAQRMRPLAGVAKSRFSRSRAKSPKCVLWGCECDVRVFIRPAVLYGVPRVYTDVARRPNN